VRRAQTLVEKIIARAAGTAGVAAGDLVTAKVDLAFAHDSSGPRRWKPMLHALGATLWDPRKVAIFSDHYAPAVDADSAAILKLTREFASEHHIEQFFDMEGICHVLLAEHGMLAPGMFIAGGDSHTPMAGAFATYAAGFGATDMVAIVATGETWLSVPETIRVEWNGVLDRSIVAKDIMLLLCRKLGMDNAFKAIEFCGTTIDAMSMLERMVLSNMAAELGAETGVMAPDATTLEYLRKHDAPIHDEQRALSWRSDADATFASVHRFVASELAPQIAGPDSPANSGPVEEFAGTQIDQAYIGACVGAKIDDLRMAAQILKGRKVARGVRLLIAPASQSTSEIASREGTLATLLEAGAILLPSGCGACAGLGAGLLAEGDVCISSTNRNFKGRMGHTGAKVYLGSPYSVAAAAITGQIVDARTLLAEREAVQ
jgi:3-isopropylmalate/(R)-2-methylmalate dehydratase large subunit